MTETLRVRMYNVRFGDAILVSLPDRDARTGTTTQRHILIDVGNVLNKEGGDDAVFEPVVKDILKQLAGQPLDLYVMTHEHLDHAQGLFHAATKLYEAGELKRRLSTRYAWLTASAAPDYYDGGKHPDAKKKKVLLDASYKNIARHLQLLPAAAAAPFSLLLANNNPRAIADCVGFLRGLAPKKHTYYIYRGFNTAGKHPFQEARFEIWAPEEDTSDYYCALSPMALLGGGRGGSKPSGSNPEPPQGVDAGAFYDLLESRQGGFADNLLAIDKAANNTSVVFSLEWRHRRLLFAGDAELASWRMMRERQVLKPVDLLKVSHHGSHNGTPDPETLDFFLPKPGSGSPRRWGAMQLWRDTYSGIPDDATKKKLRQRCTLKSTLDKPSRPYFDIEIADS